jgi:hypothetical protein
MILLRKNAHNNNSHLMIQRYDDKKQISFASNIKKNVME